MKISQIPKTVTTTQTLTTKYPVFIVTFQLGTDIREVLQIKILRHCIIRWERYKNTKPVRQYFNCIYFGQSSNFCHNPQNVSSAINYMQRGNARKNQCTPPKGSAAAVPTRPIFSTVLHFNNSTPDIDGNGACRRQHLLLSSSKLTFQLSSRRRLHPDGIKHGLKLHLNL